MTEPEEVEDYKLGLGSLLKNVGDYTDDCVYGDAVERAEELGLDEVDEVSGLDVPKGISIYELDDEEYLVLDNRKFRGVQISQIEEVEAAEEFYDDLGLAGNDYASIDETLTDISGSVVRSEQHEMPTRAQDLVTEVAESLN